MRSPLLPEERSPIELLAPPEDARLIPACPPPRPPWLGRAPDKPPFRSRFGRAPAWRFATESPREVPPNLCAVDLFPYGVPPRCCGLCCQRLFPPRLPAPPAGSVDTRLPPLTRFPPFMRFPPFIFELRLKLLFRLIVMSLLPPQPHPHPQPPPHAAPIARPTPNEMAMPAA